MANAQLSWNGQEPESRDSQKSLRLETENRENIVTLEQQPIPDMILMTGNLDGKGLLSITAGGKTHHFSMNRKLVIKIHKESAETLWKMEPGK